MKDDLFCVLFEEDLGDDFNDTDLSSEARSVIG